MNKFSLLAADRLTHLKLVMRHALVRVGDGLAG